MDEAEKKARTEAKEIQDHKKTEKAYNAALTTTEIFAYTDPLYTKPSETTKARYSAEDGFSDVPKGGKNVYVGQERHRPAGAGRGFKDPAHAEGTDAGELGKKWYKIFDK